MARIRKRLGGKREKEIATLMIRGFAAGDHLPWISRLLEWYYDPMYDYQIDLKHTKIVFTGNTDEVLEYLRSLG